jgi:hypothetical protein
MKNILLLISILFSTLMFSQNQDGTEVSGIISNDTSWTLENSPYYVKNYVTINEGAKLTIESGVQIKMENGAFLIVKGTLIAEGNAENKIEFNPFGRGIHFDDSAIDYDENTDTGNRIKYANFKNPSTLGFDPPLGEFDGHITTTPNYDGQASNKQVSILISNSEFDGVMLMLNGWGGSDVNEVSIIEKNIMKNGWFEADNESNIIAHGKKYFS